MYIYMAKSLCYSSKPIITLLIGYNQVLSCSVVSDSLKP